VGIKQRLGLHQQAIHQESFLGSLLTRFIPILDLQANEDADDNNDEVDKYGEPVLRFYVFGDSPQQHS
jgi:hypothetical protein